MDKAAVLAKAKEIFGDIVVDVANEGGGGSREPEAYEHDAVIDVDGCDLYVQFQNGHIVRFGTSEWGSISKADKMGRSE